MRTFSKFLTAATAAAALGGAVVASASPAMAAGRNGVCDPGEFCYYFNSGEKGSVSDFTGSVADYGAKQPSCYDFKGAGNGRGVCVKNNAASVWNRSGSTVRVYYNSRYGGHYQDFGPGARGNLDSVLKNQNASHQFLGSTPPPPTRTNLSWALYQASGGRITCGFDGYTSTPGRHEGIDIARGIGSSVHALVAGQIINVAWGHTGSSGLSTIAVYNASLGRTIIYLHSAPLGSLRTGQWISKGQVIASESYRGVSGPGGAHTHVEMRVGRWTLAAKSVGDWHLENPNPTQFWISQGYNVR
ncbi:peptidase inhibitor family I36 protein [Actinomadura gamaensis]|uniref:Peptidase inhibitor family I36 protein n=1 Tax=Actinomadura gamaensis TaxID=1763541 RepID=A0ABV9U1X0_9ACTN